MVKLVDIHGPSEPYKWDFDLEQKWKEERGLDGIDEGVAYEAMVHIEKLEAEIERLKRLLPREPEEWETVCYECNGSGWRARG